MAFHGGDSGPRRRWVRALVGVPLVLYGASGILAGVRALSPPRVQIRVTPGRPPVIRVIVDTPARVETWLDVEAVQGPMRSVLVEEVIPRRRWAYWNHRWKHQVYAIELGRDRLTGFGPGPVTIRASVQPGFVWLWRRAPVTEQVQVGSLLDP